MGTAPTKTSKFGANLPAPTHSSSETKTQSPAPSTRRAEDLKDETLSEQQSVVQAPDKNERRAPARPSTNKDLAKSKHIDNPSLEALPPVITKQGTILDQIVQEKQHRAQRLAEEIANRIES